MSDIVAAFNYLQVKYHSEDYAKSKETALKVDVQNALSRAQEALASVAKLSLATPPPTSASFLWKFEAKTLQTWFDMARTAFQAQVGLVYKNCVQLALALAKQTEDATPRYAHMFQKKINVALAKKVLLNTPNRKVLSERTIALHGRLALAVFVRTEWAVVMPTAILRPSTGGAEEDDPEDEDPDLETVKTTFNAAKAACSVTAACSVLYEHTGPKQQAEKAKLLSRARPEFSESLQKALESI